MLRSRAPSRSILNLPRTKYLADESIDDALDQEIRNLLTRCFTKPQDVIFRTQRYFYEPYPHRWIIQNERGALIAHIGVHDKHIETGKSAHRIGGICEVCVHPDHRGKHYVKFMLEKVHTWFLDHEYDYAILFGDPRIYSSSGYLPVDNVIHGDDHEGWKPTRVLIREVSGKAWPMGKVLLPGAEF